MLYSSGELETSGVSGRKPVYTDEFFNGKEKQVSVYYDTTLSKNRDYAFVFYHISEAYFYNERSRSALDAGGLQIFSDRANLYSNVVNGYGAVVCGNSQKRVFGP